ncbi:MAG: HIT family protein [Clostridia bacterium]|nr:HIT family protein [Clostridia bacterium]
MCLVCDRIEWIRRGENPYFVRELETGYVVIGDHQQFFGYALFLCRRHVAELYELEPEFRQKHLMEMATVAEAVHRAFGADKMNYELLGNGDGSHAHWHLFPRRAGDLSAYSSAPGPVWWTPREVMYDEGNRPDAAALEDMKARLAAELEKLL